MSSPVDEEAPLPIPNLALPQAVFVLSNPAFSHLHDKARQDLINGITSDEMAPFLETIIKESPSVIGSTDSAELLSKLQAANETALAKFETEIKEAEDSMGETEVSDVLRKKAAYLTKIGDKERSLAALELALEKTPGIGARIDIVLTIIRVGFFFNDNNIITTNLPKASVLVNEGGDWDRRNRLKVYQGLYYLVIRDFKQGGELLIDALSTFTATELMAYDDFVGVCVLGCMVWMERVDIKKKIINSPEIRQIFPSQSNLEDFATSLHNCDYAKFFKSLAAIEQDYLLPSKILSPHARYFVREMRIISYAQLLASYKSLTLDSMARAFGVSPEFIDSDLSRLISSGRLNCTIDKVSGIVMTSRRDKKNAQYEQVIKQGDLLLNSLSKLSKVIV
ncbi:26S proteasome regulatory complex, subunit RPN7/PSMD6 [Phaffia rhodozyma]|uniref:26S proteasome regulatory complex, subunit RPN7/PSMD6 n=1 Tax=Phaffia rhodozyma TaxID=264483 RepID=A0A0F7SHX0_PHARH|nr:26S proteasome regulatory complex, subunit RPN7/PSMD6 [Phaffia rhodozyma]